MSSYRRYFGMKNEPFTNEISIKNLLKLPGMLAVKERMDYNTSLGGIMVLTGDVGSGKSTSIRWALSHYHSSQYKVVTVIASSSSAIDFYKQIAWGFDLELKTGSRSFVVKNIKEVIRDLVLSKKQRVILVIDEAALLRSDIFSELHTLTQFNHDSQNLISIVFAGQVNLIDKFTYRSSAPIASRVIARSHLIGVDRDQLTEYLRHHLKIVGIKKMLFSENTISAIQQGSGGIFRKANSLARGGLIAAAAEKKDEVTPEHIRIASTELI